MQNIPVFNQYGFRRADGVQLAMPHYRDLELRLIEEAGPINGARQQIQRDIFHRHGRKCIVCATEIPMYWKGQPLLRKIDGSHAKPKCWFHHKCYEQYKSDKAKKRKRANYIRTRMQPQQPAQLAAPQPQPALPAPLLTINDGIVDAATAMRIVDRFNKYDASKAYVEPFNKIEKERQCRAEEQINL